MAFQGTLNNGKVSFCKIWKQPVQSAGKGSKLLLLIPFSSKSQFNCCNVYVCHILKSPL